MQPFKLNFYTPFQKLTPIEKEKVINFLFNHLDQYGDAKKDIQKAIEYAMKEIPSPGGGVITYEDNGTVVGAVVLNKTGMGGYIPENILVYIAVNGAYRGKGVGKSLMLEAINKTEGDIALHVEPDNPAKFLYEKVGFTNKYLEMRYKKGPNQPSTPTTAKKQSRPTAAPPTKTA